MMTGAFGRPGHAILLSPGSGLAGEPEGSLTEKPRQRRGLSVFPGGLVSVPGAGSTAPTVRLRIDMSVANERLRS